MTSEEIKTDIQPILIGGTCVERVSDFPFLGVHIEEKLTWDKNTTQVVKKAQQRLHFLKILKKNNMSDQAVSACVFLPLHHGEHP